MMSNKGDDLCFVFYVDGVVFFVFVFIEDGLLIFVSGVDFVVNDMIYKFGVINLVIECIVVDVIFDFKSGCGFYEFYLLIVNDNLLCKKFFVIDEIVVCGGNQI